MKCARCRQEKETKAYSTPIGSCCLCLICATTIIAEWFIKKQDIDLMKES